MVARLVKDSEDEAFSVYVTDTLRLIAKNGGMSGATYPQARFAEIIEPRSKDNRTCAEIVDDVVAKCGLVVK